MLIVQACLLFFSEGFLGFFTLLFLWPGLVILHFTNAERLEWPDPVEWLLLVLNGFVGMVISHLLWLWYVDHIAGFVFELLYCKIPLTWTSGNLYARQISLDWINANFWVFF